MGIFNNKNLDLLRREQRVRAGEEMAEDNKRVLDNKKKCLDDLSNDEHEFHKAKEEKGIELAKLDSDIELRKSQNELGSEKHRSDLFLNNSDLIKKNTLIEAEVKSKQLELDYTEKHLESILASKDGIIKGQELAITMYKEQMDYMQKVLAVAVGKIPTVDFSTLKFSIEQPALTKGSQDKGNQDRGGDKNKPEQQK